MEYGIGEGLPIYSGGLGMLAGDHIKSASDLGMPIIGHFSGVKSGHMHTNMLLKILMSDKTNYEIVNLDDYEAAALKSFRVSA